MRTDVLFLFNKKGR